MSYLANWILGTNVSQPSANRSCEIEFPVRIGTDVDGLWDELVFLDRSSGFVLSTSKSAEAVRK